MRNPKIFISYSHDSNEHKEWVLKFSSDLCFAGVDVILDQWDLRLGQDLSSFMHRGIEESDRVLMICSDNYVDRANSGKGGVGYERLIVSSEVVASIGTIKFIPVIRGNSGDKKTPSFLGPRMYIDFESDKRYTEQLARLVGELHSVTDSTKPKIGNKSNLPELLESRKEFDNINGVDDLFNATSRGDVAQIRKCLLSGVGINEKREFDDATALQVAIDNEQLRAVIYLLKNGADLYLRDRYGSCALDEAKVSDNHAIRKAIGRSISVRRKNLFGNTVYYNGEICPCCLGSSFKQDTWSNAGGDWGWSINCASCDWAYGE